MGLSRIHTRGALAHPHLVLPRPLSTAAFRPPAPTRAAVENVNVRRPAPPVPLMSLVIPVPTRYRSVMVPTAGTMTAAPIQSQSVAVPSSAIASSTVDPEPGSNCRCVWYAPVREMIVSCMKWACVDSLGLMLMKAEQIYPSLEPLLRGNIVAAAFAVREEERILAVSETRNVERNHIEFLSDFEL